MARDQQSRTDTKKGAEGRQEKGKADMHYSDISGGGGETDWHHSHNPKLNSRTRKA